MTKTSLLTHPLGETANVISWVDQELAGCRFRDNRLGQRLRKLLTHMAGAIGGSLPLACQDWANTKAAYRFLSNPKVSDHEILQGHFLVPEPALPPSVALSWSFRTQPNCPTKEHSLNGLVRPAGSTAAGTRKVAPGCTRSAGCSCTLAWL